MTKTLQLSIVIVVTIKLIITTDVWQGVEEKGMKEGGKRTRMQVRPGATASGGHLPQRRTTCCTSPFPNVYILSVYL